jgi:hypothetical protein
MSSALRAEQHHLDKEKNMSLVRWDPLRELEDMSTRLNVRLPKTEKAKPAIEVKVA